MSKVSDFLPVIATEDQRDQLQELAMGFSLIASALTDTLPNGPHKSTALRKLLEAKFFAAQAVTHTDLELSLGEAPNKSFYLAGRSSI
jgi:hypothetical protein